MKTLDETLTTLAAHAPKLRAAGVRRFSVDPKGTVAAELDPHEAAPARDTGTSIDDADTHKDPLDDPDLYGRTDGRVPGFDRPTDDD